MKSEWDKPSEEGLSEHEIASQALEVLKKEASSILEAARRLDATQLHKAVTLLLRASGKVILLGTGKSGIAARKIAGTLTSTGTAAIYLHPIDALHGDLGIITADDVAIAVSNSGETDELVALVTHLRSRKIPLIAIVGNSSSTLASKADAVLVAFVDQEVGHLSLAPTTSTTVAIVIGDALAMILMKAKGFSAEDFALNHPAGRLGKRLTLSVGDIMHSGTANPAVGQDTGWMEVLEAITNGGLGAVSVVDGENKLVGLITDGDVRRSTQQFGFDGLKAITAAEFMTTNPVSVKQELLAYDALRLMEDRPSQISVLPVVDDQYRSVGLIRVHDIVRAGLR